MSDKPKTFGIKLSELRPCDHCGKKLVPFFKHIQIRTAVFNPQNVNGVLGLMHMWGNPRTLGLAEAMAPRADDAVEVLDEPETVTTLYLCAECCLKEIDLSMLCERRIQAEKPKTEAANG